MSLRLGHKSKSSASKKKSPGTSRSNTPTNSQSIMGGEKNQEEQLSIDDVLTGEDIEKLRIKEEDLKKVRCKTHDISRKHVKIHVPNMLAKGVETRRNN